MPKITEQKNVISSETPIERKIAEIRFAGTIAMHSPIMASDHIGEIISQNFCTNDLCNNKLRGFSVHRTKCTMLIKNVIY